MIKATLKWTGWGVASVIATVIILNLMLPQPIQRRFDAEEWARLSADKNGKQKRGKMAEDLIQNHLIKGMPREKALALLGQPETDSYERERCLRYYLGWYKSLMDPESLIVCFGGDGLLKEIYIRQH